MFAVHTTQFWQSRRICRRPAALFAALVVYIIVILVAAPEAQQAPAFTPAGGASSVVRDAPSGSEIELLVGRSTVLNIGSTISRVSLTVPDVADAMVTSPTQLLIHGKQPGTISLFVWDRGGEIKTYEVSVRRDLSALNNHLRQLFPGESVTVLGSGKDVVISGTVTSQYVVEKAADVAAGYVEKKENVVNLLKQQEGTASNQVMLRVRFAEVSRSALQELGASLFTGPTGYKDVIARTTTQQFPAPHYTELNRTSVGDELVSADGKYTLSDFLNIFVFSNKYNIGTVIRALSERGLFQSLAEPNLISTNGKEASFLAGGEYPYPVVQPGAGGAAVTIMFKEFGIRLGFTPTVLGGDLINLKVRPEVSALDFSNAITLAGFRVPALSTRRTETEVELRDGQTFAIAGLLNNTVTDSMRKIPGIGDIPILGWLFKSKAIAKNQTELVVMITPTIVRRGQMGVSEGLPSMVEPFLGRPARSMPVPDPYIGSPRYPPYQVPGGDDLPPPPPAPAQSHAPGAVAPAVAAPAALPSRPIPQPTPAVMPPAVAAPAGAPALPPAGALPLTFPSSESTFSPLQSGSQTGAPPPPAGTPVVPSPLTIAAPAHDGPGAAVPAHPAAVMPPAASQPAHPVAFPADFGPQTPPPAAMGYPDMPPGFGPGPAAQPIAVLDPASAPLTADQVKAIENARKQERKALEAEAKRQAAEQKRRP